MAARTEPGTGELRWTFVRRFRWCFTSTSASAATPVRSPARTSGPTARAPSTCGGTTSRPSPERAIRASGRTRRSTRAGGKSDGDSVELKGAGKPKSLTNIFHNPHLPVIDDYYEPFTYKYLDLIESPAGDDQPTARPVSMITGKPMDIKMGPNWDDDLSGSPDYARNDPEPREPHPGRAARRCSSSSGMALLLPAAHLQPLPQPGLRRLLSVGRDLQARRGRRGAHQPVGLPRLAHVRHRLPLQEDLLQLEHRQVGEVHPLLSAPRVRPRAGVHALLRRPHPLPRRPALRRRPDRERRRSARTPNWSIGSST